MEDLDQVLRVGTLLILEEGEYSDRSWNGPVRVLRDVTKRELVEKFLAQFKVPDDGWKDGPDPGDFMAWLGASDYVEEVGEVNTWHVGSYGRFEP